MSRIVSLITSAALSMAPVVWGQTQPKQAPNRTAEYNAGDKAGVQQALAFERKKAREDAAQARKERAHPEQFNYQADRQAENDSNVHDSGAKQQQKGKDIH